MTAGVVLLPDAPFSPLPERFKNHEWQKWMGREGVPLSKLDGREQQSEQAHHRYSDGRAKLGDPASAY
jgi:hypothetical protein